MDGPHLRTITTVEQMQPFVASSIDIHKMVRLIKMVNESGAGDDREAKVRHSSTPTQPTALMQNTQPAPYFRKRVQ